MNEREVKILRSIAQALPLMSESKKGEFIGYAQAMVDIKNSNKQDKKPEKVS